MKVLVLGASGATGKNVVMQLIRRKIDVRIVVREQAIIPDEIQNNTLVEVVRGNIYDYSEEAMKNLISDCNSVVSCLGHNINFKGLFGKPRNLVVATIKNVCEAVKKLSDKKIKLVLMSTTAFTNTSFGEKNSIGERIILSLLMVLLPPHRDNMKAAWYLQKVIGSNTKNIEWIAVRPDALINSDKESAYELHKSTIRSPLFDAGKVSRINVSRFMCDLLTDDTLWSTWKYKMPVIYNKNNE